MAENLANLSPTVKWKSEFFKGWIWYINKKISKKVVEGDIWFLLNAYSKLGKERYWRKTIKQQENGS